ncbi:MAG: TonB family protein [Gemmatimonadaceae bacterium]
MKIGLLALVGVFVTVTAQAQVIQGRVVDDRRKLPLRNVTVTVIPDTGNASVMLARATTDSAGEFFVDAPAAGRYRLGLSDADGHTFVAPVFSIAEGQTVQRELVIPSTRTFYLEFEVEHPVAAQEGYSHPKYPLELRKENLSGEVLTEFVVDTLGRADMKTFRIVRSTHLEFSDAVREWLRTARFTPATIGGHKVPQLVHEPFIFSLNY